jgi:hypothetical protein
MLRVIFFVLLLLGCRCGQGYGEEDKWRGHSRGYHSHARHFANHFNPSDSVDMANQLMAMKTVYDGIDRSNRTNRLAVMILFAYGAELVKKIIFLKCALKTLQQHMDQTPMDIFIWMQYDDDAAVNDDISFNLVEHLDKNNMKMVVVGTDGGHDHTEVLDGLAELTKFWLEISKYKPPEDFYSRFSNYNENHQLETENWNRDIYCGYFYLLSVELWFEDLPQDFLTTVLRSGRDIEGRWQEQAVMNMFAQLFIPKSQVYHLAREMISHKNQTACS